MHLTIDELLDYTDEERAKWKDWFTAHGNDPLKFATPMDVHPTLGALILHCFWAELFYAHWIGGDIPTEDQMRKQSESVSAGKADEVFAVGQSARKAMRELTSALSEEDWNRIHEIEGRGVRLEGPARKLIAHILVHEMRHWAQIAVLVRQHDLAPPGEHDLLFSKSFGPLVRKI
jgi:uncharacterized damage-inducible protein DinB